MFAMETIRSEEEDTGSPIGVGPDDADLQLLHLSSITSDAAAAAAASIVINPFWAENEERRELLCGQLTVKSPAGDSSGDSQASDGAPGKKSGGHRRPLVKQKKHCQSVDDMVAPAGASGAASVAAPAGEAAGVTIPVTINVSGTQPRSGSANGTVGGAGGSGRRPSPRPDSSIEYQLGSESNDADDAGSLHHLKPSSLSGVHASSGGSAGRPGGSSPSSILRGQRSTPRQLSVESRVTVAQGPIEDGAPLPAAFEPVPLHLYGKPLLEIDPTVREKTFVVVSKRFRKNYIHRFSASSSFFLFSPWNPLRRIAIYLSTHPYFDYVVMTTILLNCIFLAMTEPVEQAEIVFLGIYTCEMVVKAISKGLILDRMSYLRSPWNWLDFVVILSGYATMGVEIGNLAGLRTFRVLRALKTVSIIPGLRTIINALLKSMRQLVEVMTLIVFCLSVLALFALQVYMGELRNKCVVEWRSNETDLTWTAWVTNDSRWLLDQTGVLRLCGNLTGAWPCPAGYVCIPGLGSNPNFGFTNFDTFPWSMLTTFQLITLDYWENIYNMVLAVCGPYTLVFFVVVVFFGSFYLINLMLAVVAMSYEEEAGETQECVKILADYREESTFSFDPGKLSLILLEKGHQQAKGGKRRASRKPRVQAVQHPLTAGPLSPHLASPTSASATPGLPQPLWALAKSEMHKVDQAKANLVSSMDKGEAGRNPPSLALPPSRSTLQTDKPSTSASVRHEDEDQMEMGFSLQIVEAKIPYGTDKDCDSGVHTSVNFASSFNTDVGYSSETSRAPSYPSSVVFKRRTFTNKSVSQNYSSLTESIGSQGCADPTRCTTPSPINGDHQSLHPHHPSMASSIKTAVRLNNCDSRRLSYKRACDPDKRISLAFDSMLSEDSDLSYGSQSLPMPVLVESYSLTANCNATPEQQQRIGSNGPSANLNEASRAQIHQIGDNSAFQHTKLHDQGTSTAGGDIHLLGHSAGRRSLRSRKLSSIWHECVVAHSRLKAALSRLVQSPWMDFFITVSILMNTAFLAAEHHGMSPETKKVLDIGNKVFTSVFTMECVLKLGALGLEFFRNGWNVFDFVIVLASLVDLGLEIVNGLSVLRGMRLMRVLRLAQSWTTMRVLLSIILSSLGALANLTFVLAIVVYIFAVIGMQLFGKDYTPDNFAPDPVPRWNFKDFFHAFMMIFRILCGEWAEPLWDCMRAESSQGPETCFAVFLPALVMGNFLVLNLFLALLLNSFSCEELKSRKQEIDEDSKLVEGLKKIRSIAKATRTLVNMPSLDRSEQSKVDSSKFPTAVDVNHSTDGTERSKSVAAVSIVEPAATMRTGTPPAAAPWRSQSCGFLCRTDDDIRDESTDFDVHRPTSVNDGRFMPAYGRDDSEKCDSPWRSRHSQSCLDVRLAEDDPIPGLLSGDPNVKMPDFNILMPTVLTTKIFETTKTIRSNSTVTDSQSPEKLLPAEPPDCFPQSLYQRCRCCRPGDEPGVLWTHWGNSRILLLRVVKHPFFEWSVLILIFGSSITLCFEDIYLEENPRLQNILRWTNTTFAILFAMEMVIKWIALGIKYYFSSVWTALDFVIVMVSIISVAVEDTANLSALRSLRTLRALRPLRAISRWQGMKIVVNALMFAIPAIFNVLLVCLVFWLVFSILGVQLFGGKFYKCLDENGERLAPTIIDTKNDCLERNLTWVNSPIHFDHVGHAYLALFQVATFEGWMELMADAVDVRGIDLQPSYEANLWAYLYFVVFIVCGAFFTLNLFIGVIIDNFNMLKKKYEGGVLEMFLTESQKHYYTAMKKLGRKKPRKVIRRPLNPYLALFYDIAMSRRFEIAIFAMIFFNMLVMAVEHYGQPDTVAFILELFNALFTTMFALEAVVKMIGLRHHYFTLPWNLFDLILVSASIVGLIMEDVLNEFPISPTLLRVVRVFRLGRVLRLVKAAKGIRKLLFALIVSLPALFNIGALLALITFIYAIIGMALFGHVTHSGALSEFVNFETFGRSMLLLFRLMTGAGWNDILNPLLIQPPDCDITYKNLPYGNCGNPTLATLYLVSFIVLSSMIVINMYIAVLLENFNQAHREEELGLGEEDLERFYAKWSRFDPHATQFIAFGELSDFVTSLDSPLGIPRPNMAALVNLDIPIASGDRVHCLDILHALTRRVLGDVEDTEHFRKLQQQMDEKFKKQFPTRREIEVVSSTAKWKQRDTAARVVQKAYRRYLRVKMEAEMRRGERGNVQTQTSFRDSDSSFEYESDRVSLHSVLHRLSSLFHTYLGGGSRTGGEGSAGSRRESPSPSQSAAVSRQSSTRHRQTNSTFLDVLVPSRRSSIWSLSTMVVAAQVHNESSQQSSISTPFHGSVRRSSRHGASSGQQQSTTDASYSSYTSFTPYTSYATYTTTTAGSLSSPHFSGSSSSVVELNENGTLIPSRTDVIVKLTKASDK